MAPVSFEGGSSRPSWSHRFPSPPSESLMSRSFTVLLLAMAAWCFTVCFSPAQDGIPNSSKAEMEKKFLPKKAEFDKFLTGQETVTAKDYALIDLGAQFYA